MAETFDIKRTLDLIGLQTTIHLKDRIKTGSFATGALFNSLRHEVVSDDTRHHLSVYADQSFFFVEHGRRAGGKLPPEEPIKSWMKTVGIPEDAIWPIRMKIAVQGIKPKNYLFNWIAAKEVSWQKQLEDSAVLSLVARFTERFKSINPKIK